MSYRGGGLRPRARVAGLWLDGALVLMALLAFTLAPAGVLAGSKRPVRPGALRTVPVAGELRGRVLSRAGRLFVPVSASAAAVAPGREIARLRAADSDTFSAGHGVLAARIYPFPVNFRDRSGRWGS